MKKLLLLLPLLFGCLHADTLLVSDFSNFAPGYYSQSGLGPWSDQTAQSGASAFTLGDFGNGTPGGNIGNGFIQWLGDTPQDWSAYSFVVLSGLAGATNGTPNLGFYVEDINGTVSSLTQFALNSFNGGLTSISVSLLAGGVDLTQVAFWGFTVAEAGNPDFAFTFDNLVLSTTAPVAAVPEAASPAILLGFTLLGLVNLRRRVYRA